MSKNRYLSEFLSMRCAGDVINAVTPVQRFEKEITEAMGVRHELRKFVLAKPGHYRVLDLCAGNALAGILSVFSLPVKEVEAVDINPRQRPGFAAVQRWSYRQANILQPFTITLNEDPTILVSSHACKKLAERIIELYNEVDFVKGLVLIPCCVGSLNGKASFDLLNQKLSKYDRWCLQLAWGVKDSKVRLFKDEKILSPCNNVISAKKQI